MVVFFLHKSSFLFFINQKSRHKLQQDSVYEIVITFAISLYVTQNQITFNNRSIKHTG